MKIKICLLLLLGFSLFAFSKAEAKITWNSDGVSPDVYDYNATDLSGYYFNLSIPYPVALSASSDKSSAGASTQGASSINSDVATAVEPPQGTSTPGLSMASAAWGNSFEDSSSDSGGATVYAYADSSYALDNGPGVLQNGQNVTSYIERFFTVDSNATYVLTASAAAPVAWTGTATGTATIPAQPALTGSVYLLQTDNNTGITTTVQSFDLQTLLSGTQNPQVSLVSGDLYTLVVALCAVTDLGGEAKPVGIDTSYFTNIDGNGFSLGNIDGTFNAGTQESPITVTASIAPQTPPSTSGWDNGAVSIQNTAYMNLGWFGVFYDGFDPWIYHLTLGWLYAYSGSTPDSIWFWDLDMNSYVWTNSTLYPWFYRYNDQTWLYYEVGTSNPPQFYNTTKGQVEDN